MNKVYLIVMHSNFGDNLYTDVEEICDSFESVENYIFNQRKPLVLPLKNCGYIILDFVTNTFHICNNLDLGDISSYYTIDIKEVKHYGK